MEAVDSVEPCPSNIVIYNAMPMSGESMIAHVVDGMGEEPWAEVRVDTDAARRTALVGVEFCFNHDGNVKSLWPID